MRGDGDRARRLVAMLRPLWVQVNNVYGTKNRSTDGLVAIDEFTVFSKRLSEAELRLLYDKTRAAALGDG